MNQEEVVKYLRACLLSAKGGVRIEDLSRDYKILVDENIPFRKLGYQSLPAFLHSIPDIRTIEKGGECYIEAIPKEETAHLKKLVSWQKTPTKKNQKKLIITRKPTTFHQPMATKKNVRSTKSGHDNFYPQATTRQTMPPYPLMSTKITVPNNEKPRYIQSISGVPPSSPSKRLKDRKANPMSSTNQSINKPRDDPHLKNNEKVVIPVISQKPKTVNNNIEIPNKGKHSNISDRLKVTPNIPSLLNMHNSIPTLPSQSEVLSPLSPAQVLASGNIMQFQCPPNNSLVPSDNAKQTVLRSHPTTTDPREELMARTNALHLPDPIYQILPTKFKNTKEPAVYAQVKIGPYGYASYPEEARTEDDAQKLAAKIALLDLTEKYGSPSSCAETTNRILMKERILKIIDTHPNGIFMHQVPIYYTQQYKEVLPTHWEKTIEECAAIVLEQGVDNSIILRRFVSSTGKMRNVTPTKKDKVKLNPIGPPVPGQLQLPEEDYWIVSVIYVVNTVEVWVRLVGDAYSDQFDIMTTEMMLHYGRVQQPLKPVAIENGSYYAVFKDESWHRVRCIDYDSSTGLVTALFIDYGDEDTSHYSELQKLDRKFCVLPAQAFRLSLFGLEDFKDCDSIVSQIEKLFLDRALYVEVISRDTDQNGPFATVLFYDTNGPDDINLNAVLSKQILEQVLVAPKLDMEGQVSEVFVSHIEQNGDIYVQIQSESMKLFVALQNRLIHMGLNTKILRNSVETTVDTSKIYFISVHGNWYRGKVINDSSYSHVKVLLIDFGKTVTTGKGSLLCLEKLSDILAKYPAQALKVHLHNIDKSMFNEKMVGKLNELAPKGEPLLVKVIASSKSDVPVVELFKRIQPSNMLVSINNTLALEEELTRSHGDGNNNIKPRKRIERMNSKLGGNEDDEAVKSLKPPKISGLGQYFDVHVTMAAHPGNFTVQPFDDKNSLETMMIQLQEACSTYKGPSPTSETIIEGKLYAARHIDSHWYRVCISSIIRENMVSVYFCDFGDVSVLPLDKLQPLKSQFLELPYQAIKARLVGIRPINVDWSVEDSIRFQELVVDKNFVSIVVESGPDGVSSADTVLGLKLIDVDTSEDIYIHQLLVDEGRAVFVDQ